MDWWQLLLAFFGVLTLLLLLRVPVAFALLGINLLAAVYMFGTGPGLRNVVLSVANSVSTFVLIPVPLFILLGELLFRSNLASRAIHVLDLWLGRVPGRLGVLTTLTGTVFGTLSGSSMANTAMMGTVLLPEMERRGYSRHISVGSILAAGGLAMVIPPSSQAVLLGATAGIPVGPLLMAGVIPGLIMGINYTLLIVGRCLFNPRLAPRYETPRTPWSEKIRALVQDVLPLGFIIFVVLGLIFLGVATPSESAALGVVAALILAAAYGKLSWAMVWESSLATLRATSVIFFILVGSTLYSQVMSFSGATQGMVQAFTALADSPWLIMLLMNLVVLVLGAFLDQVSIMMVTLPFFMPVVQQLGWDPLWFAVIILINLQIGMTTPPFGMSLFVMKGVAPRDMTMQQIYATAAPYLLGDILTMILVMLFPVLATWLPELMFR